MQAGHEYMQAATQDASRSRILVVEDEYFLADDMTRSLSGSGVDVVGPVATVKAALDLLAEETAVDGAVLDINLRGEMVYPVADLLLERGVPFVFSTGYDEHVVPRRYSEVRRCEKPVDPDRVTAALLQAVK